MMFLKQFLRSIKRAFDSTGKEPEVTMSGKRSIPVENQREILGFFMTTSVPRRKARKTRLQTLENNRKGE